MHTRFISLFCCLFIIGYSTPSLASKWQASFVVEGLLYDSIPSHYEEEPHDEDEDEHEEEAHAHEHAGLAGFPSAGHDHGFREGLHMGHLEGVLAGQLNDYLSSRFTVALTETEDEGLEVELEEGFLEAQGLGDGMGLKVGRFFSDIGYLSSKHNHEWDFADNALIYKGMFGAHAYNDGLQLNYVAPSDLFIYVGAEVLRGENFPAYNSKTFFGSATAFVKVGGDIGTSHSWLVGLGHWRAPDIRARAGELHAHENTAGEEHHVTPHFSGHSYMNSLSAVYKWSPNGNSKQRHLKLQAEYFRRNETGDMAMLEEDGHTARTFAYDGMYHGFYVQAIYQFMPQWRIGLRYDWLDSDKDLIQVANGLAATEHMVEAAGLADEGHHPSRYSVMLDFTPREYNRWRLQFNLDKSQATTDKQIILQYLYSFGSHGAHSF